MTVGELWRLAREKAATDKKVSRLLKMTAVSYYKKKPSSYELPEKFAAGIERLRELPDPTDEERAEFERHQRAGETLKARNSGTTTTPTRRSFRVAARKTAIRKVRVERELSFTSLTEAEEYINKQDEILSNLDQQADVIRDKIGVAKRYIATELRTLNEKYGNVTDEEAHAPLSNGFTHETSVHAN